MFVSLNGQRVRLSLGRWDARKALANLVKCEKDQALIELVEAHGLHEAARLMGHEPAEVSRRLEVATEKVARDRRIAAKDLTVIDLIDDLGNTPDQVAEVLQMPLREVHSRYWRGRKRLAVQRHSDALVEGVEGLKLRDFMAFELVHVLNYSIGRAARQLGLNRGHLCRQLQKVRTLLQTALLPEGADLKT